MKTVEERLDEIKLGSVLRGYDYDALEESVDGYFQIVDINSMNETITLKNLSNFSCEILKFDKVLGIGYCDDGYAYDILPQEEAKHILKLASNLNIKKTEDVSEIPNIMALKIRYMHPDTKRLTKISNGDWIDVYADEDVSFKYGEQKLVPLGFALELPKGYEAYLLPRSSTYGNWGMIQTNSLGVIDNSYCGDNDEWKIPFRCTDINLAKFKIIMRSCIANSYDFKIPTLEATLDDKIVMTIHRGDKIGQFRIIRNQPDIKFIEVESLNNENRGGFGSTGKL